MNTKQAISELKSLLSQKRAGEYAEELLDKLDFVEQEMREASASVAALKKEAEALKAGNDKVKTDQKDILDSAREELERAQAIATKTVLDAKSEGGRIIAKANEDMAKIDKAIEALKTMELSHRVAEQKAKDDLEKVEKALAESREKLQKLLG